MPDPGLEVFTRSRESDLIPGSNDPKKAERKDLEFTRALATEGYVDKATLLQRLAFAPADAETRERIAARIEHDFSG